MADTDEAVQLRQLRLLGAGTLAAGLLVVGVGTVSSRPHRVLVVGLAFLGVAALVFEGTQGATVGVSLGLLTAAAVVWLWPSVGSGETDFGFLGAMLVVVGLLNAVGAPVVVRLWQFGERLGERRG